MSEAVEQGVVLSVNGPIVKAGNMGPCAMLDLVEVGHSGLIGEIIRFDGDTATIQVYEENTGLKPGEPVRSRQMPISVALGPGMIGNIYDGIQRPLPALQELSGALLKRGEKVFPLPEQKKWQIEPSLECGSRIEGGAVVFELQESGLIRHKVMVPPTVSGELVWIAPAGAYTVQEPVYRVRTGEGKEYEGRLFQYWPSRQGRPYQIKRDVEAPLLTGQRIIDTFFPISKGGVAAIPGGFGTGKTMTQHALAKWSDADIIVYIGCGERGNEMTDVLNEFPKLKDPRSGQPIMERTILIANTSNMPVAAREISIYTGITIAEYYRDMGYDVAIMADSTSRWAEALRELSGRLEEMPAEEGFPAYLPTRLAGFYERAGAVKAQNGAEGSVSIIGAVSPPGGDFSEPVTQHTRRFIRCFWALDRNLANARHYPAISWIDSYSEYTEEIQDWWGRVDPDWRELRDEALSLLQREERLQQIVKLVGPDALPDSQRLVLLTAELIKNGFLQQNAFDDLDMYSTPAKQVFMLRLFVRFHRRAGMIIDRGAPIHKIRDIKELDELRRMKSVIPNDDAARLQDLMTRLDRALDKVEGSYA